MKQRLPLALKAALILNLLLFAIHAFGVTLDFSHNPNIILALSTLFIVLGIDSRIRWTWLFGAIFHGIYLILMIRSMLLPKVPQFLFFIPWIGIHAFNVLTLVSYRRLFGIKKGQG